MNLRTVVDMYLASQFFFAIAWFVIYFNSSLLIRFWAGSYVFSSNQVGLKMKKLSFILCAVLSTCFLKTAHSQILWYKYSDNPVIATDSPYAFEPAVLFNNEFNLYQMWFTEHANGNYHIKYAESSDGIDWQILAIPVLSPGEFGTWDDQHVRNSNVFLFNETYYLYYSGSSSDSRFQIGVATSKDGLSWTKYANNPALRFGVASEWDSVQAYNAKVFYDFSASNYKMLYTGSDGLNYQIGLAESIDGFNWVKYSENPVISPGPKISWDEYRIWTSSNIFQTDTGFTMLYTGVNESNQTNSPIGMVYSNNGYDWTKYETNPILLPGSSGEWDDEGLGNSCVLQEEQIFKLWYSGHSRPTSEWRIGLAQSVNPDSIHAALEFDGIDDVVTVPDVNGSLDLNDFTLEAWIIRYQMDTQDVIIHKGASGEDEAVNTNYGLYVAADNRAHVVWESPDGHNYHLAGASTLKVNTWYHLAGVRSSEENSLQIYVNGQLESYAILQTDDRPNTQDAPLTLGYNGIGFPVADFHAGVIDEPRVWNVARSEAQINSTINRTLNGAEPGLVGYWPLDAIYGQAVIDKSIYKNDGFLGNSVESDPADPLWILSDQPFFEPIPNDSSSIALAFDGMDDVVTIQEAGTSLDLNDFTVEAWINRSSQNTYDVIAAKGAYGETKDVNTNFAIDISDANVARVVWENEASENYELVGQTTIQAGRWYHIAGVRSAVENQLLLYVNGKIDGQVTTLGKPNTQNVPLLIGFNGVGFPADHHFSGLIDEVRIWRIPRSQEQLQMYKNTILSPNLPGLVGYWRFDEGDGQYVYDLTDNGNNGLLGDSPSLELSDPKWRHSNAPLTDSIAVAVRSELSDGQNPSGFVLYPSSPNPFNPETVISYMLPVASEVELTVFDRLGRQVAVLVQSKQNPGEYRMRWNGKNDNGSSMPSGIYLYRLRAGDFLQTHKMTLVR